MTDTPRTDAVDRAWNLAWFGLHDFLGRYQDGSSKFCDLSRQLERELAELRGHYETRRKREEALEKSNERLYERDALHTEAEGMQRQEIESLTRRLDEAMARNVVVKAELIEATRGLSKAAGERDALGRAIATAAQRAGIYNGEVGLTGPQLIQLCEDLASGFLGEPSSYAGRLEAATSEWIDVDVALPEGGPVEAKFDDGATAKVDDVVRFWHDRCAARMGMSYAPRCVTHWRKATEGNAQGGGK